MFFTEVAQYFGWPISEVKSLSPMVERACIRLKQKLKSDDLVDIKILPTNPSQTDRSGSMAIVFEFVNKPTDDLLREAHAFAWNLCEGEQVIFLIKDQCSIQAWSTLVPPSRWKEAILGNPCVIEETSNSGSKDLLRAFQWVNLADGFFKRQAPEKFRQNQRADKLLVNNLKVIRQKLITASEANSSPLSIKTCHNLLARLIFVQYLFQRKDTKGQSFLSQDVLKRLHNEGVLKAEHEDLISILSHKTDTYKLFRWLNPKFNGDLFPKAGSASFSKEQGEVKKEHLTLLADYLSGDRELETGQGLLWSYYSFETIPISFISSMYEAFLSEGNKKGDKAFYTQPYLVDFILDTALPWHSHQWNLRILDPCCGSGIFLVKAFQRIVHRWSLKHGGKTPSVQVLRKILQQNIVGIDVNDEAVRVACFSLYLAMADEIDPRQYWTTESNEPIFPELSENSMLAVDFFREDYQQISSEEDGDRYDLVIGNAPWGKNSIDPLSRSKKQRREENVKLYAEDWAKNYDWPLSYGDVGSLFYAKSLRLTLAKGGVAMVQHAGLLMNQSGPAKDFRNKLFSSAQIVEINNFSILRFELFSTAIGPSCVIYSVNDSPSDESITSYLCPKNVADSRVIIEPSDWKEITLKQIKTISSIFSTLMWGDDRHLELANKLKKMPTIGKLISENILETREGIIRGDRKFWDDSLLGRPILDNTTKPDLFKINSEKLPTNDDNAIHQAGSKDFSSFKPPQLFLKQSWVAASKRFHAYTIDQPKNGKGVLCSDSYMNIHQVDGENWLNAVWLVFNSKVAVWWQMLHSGRFLSFLPQPLESDVKSVPLPEVLPEQAKNLESHEEIDVAVMQAYDFNQSETALIDDLFTYSLANFKDGAKSIGRTSTHALDLAQDSLCLYAEWLMRILENGFGAGNFSVTLFREDCSRAQLPVRILALHLERIDATAINEALLVEDDLIELIQGLQSKVIHSQDSNAGFLIENHLRYYDHYTPEGSNKAIPTLYIVKPDRKICWTRSQAMSDADEIAVDIMNDYLTPKHK